MISHQPSKLTAKEIHELVNKKTGMLRMKPSFLKHALIKKYRKIITEKILSIFENNFSNMGSGSLNYANFFEML